MGYQGDSLPNLRGGRQAGDVCGRKMRTDYILNVTDNNAPLSILRSGRCTGPELLMKDELRALSFHCIHYIVGGGGYYRDEIDGRCRIKPGDVVISYVGRKHVLNPVGSAPIDLYYVAFQGAFADHLYGRLDIGPAVASVGIRPSYTRFFKDIMELTRTGIPYHIDRATAILHDLIVETLYLKRGKKVSRAKENPVARFVTHVQKEIVAHDIDVQAFCRREKIRYDTFRKHFRRATGLYPHAYWLERKMAAAREALFQDCTPVEQIAEALGFDDPFYFSRLFKSKTGFSPSKYREESRSSLF